ncbi:enterochelin esterase [Rhodococcus triatomae]|uniref:Enterochelin esterase n=1 Tax=Rhodococcus triatomae TaxID=300028 RepID=A0A1G8IAD5_9NOCA|nr:enterochelin esterase [Rhodococcus triatomae]QNG21003.1 enterochelin esterase [Rhodococcus triatomae]QNG23082.1 enterochelin esterase [Rhodococcus triatomae]SDI15959.1 enterochelin esterase [Rhodococcus triatomae]
MLRRVPGPVRRVLGSPTIESLSPESVPEFWNRLAAVGSPLVERLPGQSDEAVTATFCWRDPDGDESTSPTTRVYLDANGITDRAQLDRALLTRLPGTDLWHLSLEVPSRWRGGYRFLPRREELREPESGSAGWQWWRSVVEGARLDEFNALPPFAATPAPCSVAVMPDAPEHQWWVESPGRGSWSESVRSLAGRERTIAIYEPPGPAARDRPLAVLLDGRNWTEQAPLAGALDRLDPTPLVVTVDGLDPQTRTTELGCSPDFLAALTEELVPWLRREHAVTADPRRTAIGGCSLGGLTATYAALEAPETFGCAVSLSGSFWWPGDGEGVPLQKRVNPGTSRMWLEVGELEWMLVERNREMASLLREAGHTVAYGEYCGSHELLHWRDRMVAGLDWAFRS